MRAEPSEQECWRAAQDEQGQHWPGHQHIHVPPHNGSDALRPKALLLAPGASAGRDQPALVAIDRQCSADGLVVERIDFPYRLAGRRAPDRAPVLVASVVGAAERLASTAAVRPATIALGGRSMGGRICSMAVAEGLAAAALVLVSYPLHPPGRPDKLRTDHFPEIGVPCLFVSGRRDPFGSVEELETATAAVAGPVTHVWLDGDHGLRGKDQAVATIVGEWLRTLGRRSLATQ